MATEQELEDVKIAISGCSEYFYEGCKIICYGKIIQYKGFSFKGDVVKISPLNLFVNIVTKAVTISGDLGIIHKRATLVQNTNASINNELKIIKNFLEAKWFSSSKASLKAGEVFGGATPFCKNAVADLAISIIPLNILKY